MLLVLALCFAATHSTFSDIAKQAAAAREKNHLDEAIRLYRDGVRLKPAWSEGWWNLGTLSYDGNNFPAATTALRRFVKLEPAAAPGWTLLGLSEFETKDYSDALKHIENGLTLGLKGEPGVANVARYHAALLLTHFGQFEMAVKTFNDLSVRGVQNSDILIAAGLAALRVPLFPNELAASKRSFVEEVGQVVYDAGGRRAATAQVGFEKLVATYPDAPEVHYLYGNFVVASDPDRAVEEWNREIQISPKHVPARLQLALEYVKRDDVENALRYAREALKLDPGSFAAHYAAGRALVAGGDLAAGTRELEAARQLAPDSPDTRIALASAYAKGGRTQDAARERAEFVNLQHEREARQ